MAFRRRQYHLRETPPLLTFLVQRSLNVWKALLEDTHSKRQDDCLVFELSHAALRNVLEVVEVRLQGGGDCLQRLERRGPLGLDPLNRS